MVALALWSHLVTSSCPFLCLQLFYVQSLEALEPIYYVTTYNSIYSNMLSLNLAPVNKISVTSHTKNMSKQYLELPSISKIKHNMTIIWCSMRISSKTPWCYKPLQCTKYIFPFKAKFTCNDAVKYVPNILDMISPPMHYARNDEPYAVVKIVL